MMMTEKELPKPRFYCVSHPRLRKIRNGFRKVFQLAVSEEWHRLMDEKSEIREAGLVQEKKQYYLYLGEMANYLKSCYFNSIIYPGGPAIGGPKTDVSGGRVRIFNAKKFGTDEELIYALRKHFLTVEKYEGEVWHQENYEHYAPIYREAPERFVPYLKFHYKGFTPKWETIPKLMDSKEG